MEVSFVEQGAARELARLNTVTLQYRYKIVVLKFGVVRKQKLLELDRVQEVKYEFAFAISRHNITAGVLAPTFSACLSLKQVVGYQA